MADEIRYNSLFGEDSVEIPSEIPEALWRRGFEQYGQDPPLAGDFTWIVQQMQLYALKGAIGQWKANDAVKVGYGRYPNNLAVFNVFLECTTSGITG